MTFLRSVFSTRMLICITTGFASGMPLFVLLQLIPAWLQDTGVDLKIIGLLAITSMPYTWKFLWSPVMDRFVPPLGRRRGWALIAQVVLFLGIAGMGLIDPTAIQPLSVAGDPEELGVLDALQQPETVAIFALAGLIAFASASQDIVLDAIRREILPDEELGFGTSMFVNAYRLSTLVPGSLALILAEQENNPLVEGGLPWSTVYLVVAGFVGVGILTTLCMNEPASEVPAPKSFQEAVVDPFRAFFQNRGTKQALLVLAFMLLYKLGDSMATAIVTPFYLDIGFTKVQVGSVAKVASLWSSITGGILGGLLMLRIGINRALYLFGVVQLVSIVGFGMLALKGPDITWLFWVVSFEYLGVGLGTAAFVAFMARSTDKRYTATQLALLTSMTGLPRTFANASTGFIVESVGWPLFFAFCTLIAIPGLLMLPWVAPWNAPDEAAAS